MKRMPRFVNELSKRARNSAVIRPQFLVVFKNLTQIDLSTRFTAFERLALYLLKLHSIVFGDVVRLYKARWNL